MITHYRLFFEANPMPMWCYDAESLRFLAVNDAALRHYGWSREEFLAMRITDIRPPEDVGVLLEHLRERVGSPVPGVWRHQRKDGSLLDVEITAGQIELDGREAVLVLSHDVTERLRLEARLAQAEKMEAIGRLAGGVAHDFNNLLTVISGYASILGQQVGEREELSEIAHAAEQASALTRQLLAFSRRQVLNPRVIDLNAIVGGMETMVGRLIGDDVVLAVRLCEGAALVEADHAQIERVVLNLAANARDAMPQGGSLTIETARADLDEDAVAAHGEGCPGPHVVLSVSDSGAGMTEDVRRHLFEPFFTTKGSGSGTGLGLATVFGVVKQTGGSIYVYTEPGHGTTFKMYFPASERTPAATESPDGSEPGRASGSETIVVVEDDASLRELVRLMLEGSGYEVLAAASGEHAARLCAEHPGGVELLLTDVVMPEVNGRVLAERLEALFPELRVLFMSGYSDEAVFRHGKIRPEHGVHREAVQRADARAQGARGPRRLSTREGSDPIDRRHVAVRGARPRNPRPGGRLGYAARARGRWKRPLRGAETAWTCRARSASRNESSPDGRNGSAIAWSSSSERAAHSRPPTSATITTPSGARLESSSARSSRATASSAPGVADRHRRRVADVLRRSEDLLQGGGGGSHVIPPRSVDDSHSRPARAVPHRANGADRRAGSLIWSAPPLTLGYLSSYARFQRQRAFRAGLEAEDEAGSLPDQGGSGEQRGVLLDLAARRLVVGTRARRRRCRRRGSRRRPRARRPCR